MRDGIPVMLPEEARVLSADDPLLNRKLRRSAMFHVVIPARFAATRLPGKPLLQIGRHAR